MEKRDDKNLSNVVIRKVQEMILSGELQELSLIHISPQRCAFHL